MFPKSPFLVVPDPRADGMTVLAHELLGERSSSLGVAADKVAKVLGELRALDPAAPERATALKVAAEAVWAYFIQRELCGFRRHDDVIRDFAIPREVLVRLGGEIIISLLPFALIDT